MEKINWTGKWWLPNDKQNEIKGIITFTSQGKIKLSLIGILKAKVGKSVPLINGFTSCGKRITLYNCYCSRHQGSNPGFETQEYVANFLFEGSYIEQIKDLKFYKINVEFYNTNKWLEFPEGFNEKKDFEKGTLSLELGPNLYYETISENLKISLNINFNVWNNYKIYKSIAKQKSIFSIETKRRVKFDYILELYSHLKNLIVLCTQTPIVAHRISLRQKRKSDSDVKVYFSEESDKSLYLEEDKNLPPHLIEGKYFQSKFNQIVSSWFEQKNQLDFQVENFFNLYYFNSFESDKFLTNARLIESLHKTYLDDGTRKRVIYNDRCKEFLLLLKRYINSTLKIRNTDIWCKKIKDYRNELTHNNKINKSKALKLKDLERITHETKLLILTFLLQEMGLGLKESARLVKHGFRFSIL